MKILTILKINFKKYSSLPNRTSLFTFHLLLFLFGYIGTALSQNEIKIGTQTWMVENLSVTKFRNGDNIEEAKSEEQWQKACLEGKPIWCYYNFDSSNAINYGKLYNWYAVIDKRSLSPHGWHIPSDFEWTKLEKYLGLNSAKKMKTSFDWCADGIGTNICGFSAKPSGYFWPGTIPSFDGLGRSGYWWTSTKSNIQASDSPLDNNNSWFRSLHCDENNLNRSYFDWVLGLSIRCIKD